jgi:DNA-binding NarL/FixJ family response regulator
LLVDQARDLPPRQQTLIKAITWSYDLLDVDEQAVLRRLSVFVGGCELEAAEAVGAADTPNGLDSVASLIDKSLLGREEQADGEPRLRMLQTIRDYAAEQLEVSGEGESVRAHHADYFVRLVESARGELVGPHQQTWFARFERERDNLVATERWARRADVHLTVRLVAALWPFWLAREDASHARDRIDAILPIFAGASPSPTLARALHGAALIAEKLGDYATCRALLQRSVLLARQFDDRRTLALVLDSLGRQAFIEGRYSEARVMLEESHAILREIDDPVGLARLLSHLGFLEHLEGRRAAARAIFEEGLALARASEDQHRVAEFLDNLGNVSEAEADLEGARRMYQEAIDIWRQLGTGHWLAMSLNNLGSVEVRRGDLSAARTHLLESLSLAHRIGNRRRMAYAISAAAALARAEGQTERAAGLDAVATLTVTEIGAARQGQGVSRVPGALTSTPAMTLEQAVADTLAWLEKPSGPAAESPLVEQAPAAAGLTRREWQVVALLARGLTNRQIAEALVLTEGTAENYVQRILGKLGFNNRAQIAVWAVEHGADRSP